jgi:signal peptidase I
MMKLARLFLMTLVVLAVFRALVADVFVIPSASMAPTLKPGDIVLVNKAAFGFRVLGCFFGGYATPNRGDVVAFFMPAEAASKTEGKTKFVKRCTGVPHDFVSRVDGKWALCSVTQPDGFCIPAAHDTAYLTPQNIGFYKPLIEQYEHQKAGAVGSVVYVNGKPCNRFVFSQHYYFVEGDHAAESHDSRYWGLLPESHLLGRLSGVLANAKPAQP